MPLLSLFLTAIVVLTIGYWIYGKRLSKWLNLNDENQTPAHRLRNDIDFVPAGKYYLLSQHLSAIAAAGPIVGPILAGMWFGWAPTFLWIILGGIFIGGVHDMVTIVASIRHQGKSIAEVIKETIGPKAYILFLLFLWFSLIYIIAAFTDVTSSTFVDPLRGSAIASSSMLYLFLALIMGLVQKRFNPPLMVTTIIFLPFVLACIYLGPLIPLNLPSLPGLDQKMSWNVILLIYCFIAAVIPVWLILQPRGYLGGFFLALTAFVSFIGLVLGNLTQKFIIQYPAFVSWTNVQGLPLLPLLFTTVACGACSGFHCLISSGTTSKQLAKESDARPVGYGGMLLESFVAVMALGTLLLLTTDQVKTLKDPNQIYAHGIAAFLNCLGINKEFAINFALLAFATFVYDTLDVATRLGRYIFEELFSFAKVIGMNLLLRSNNSAREYCCEAPNRNGSGRSRITGWKNKFSMYVATLATLILPLWFLTRTFVDDQGHVIAGWKMFWTVFGASNQLLAALVLFGLSLWLFRKKMKFQITLLPSMFMTAISLAALYHIIKPWLINALHGSLKADPIAITSLILYLLTFFLMIEGIKVFREKGSPKIATPSAHNKA